MGILCFFLGGLCGFVLTALLIASKGDDYE